ncbi:PREDICTED: mediator of RNA polymerase II transcription subunit 4-like [Priapulus caudatus]|uniref:Mediator of RNA polymerase II transcription subunit 4 n=1 Tax=Priapulus caudatus TaxID=37621 RepID=A0ABM1F8X4_PRICU|nr:PREDICTED: mediator of RNA polymerase II transcription subunit 4-like [Priapulus caudatus]
MAAPSTKAVLLSLVDDVEIITKELFESIASSKQQKATGLGGTEDYHQLTELLVQKDQELKDALNLAGEQAVIQKKIDSLKAESFKRDQDIRKLQQQLKEAEHVLSTAIYQAKQKLISIQKATKNQVPSEELIKYAHRISASNAVAAPLTWQPGDPRRPYPQDIEMRLGFLGRQSDLPINGQMLQAQSQASQGSSLSWQPPPEIAPMVSQVAINQSAMSVDSKGHNKENEGDEVEVMSTDSSSSSSSESG